MHRTGKINGQLIGARNVYAQSINIYGFTAHSWGSDAGRGGSRRPGGRQESGRHHVDVGDKPRLLGYCRSCGLLDADRVSSMNSVELCSESARVIGHEAQCIAGDAVRIAGDIGSGIVSLAKGLLTGVGILADAFSGDRR